MEGWKADFADYMYLGLSTRKYLYLSLLAAHNSPNIYTYVITERLYIDIKQD